MNQCAGFDAMHSQPFARDFDNCLDRSRRESASRVSAIHPTPQTRALKRAASDAGQVEITHNVPFCEQAQ